MILSKYVYHKFFCKKEQRMARVLKKKKEKRIQIKCYFNYLYFREKYFKIRAVVLNWVWFPMGHFWFS